MIKAAGKIVTLADKVGKSPSQISQWKNASPDSKTRKPRQISSEIARALEDATGLARGWMDQPHDGVVLTLTKTKTLTAAIPGINPVIGMKITATPLAQQIELTPGPYKGYFDLLASGGAKTLRDEYAAGTVAIAAASPYDSGKPIPLLVMAHAGPWTELVDNNKDDQVLFWLSAPPVAYGENTFALKVEGDAMVSDGPRSYPHGAYIYVDPDAAQECQSGATVLARLGNGQVVFKILVVDAGKRFLKSLQRGYPIIEEPFDVLGKVICTTIPEDT